MQISSTNGLDNTDTTNLDRVRTGLEPTRASLDAVIAHEARCTPAQVRKAREVLRGGREDLAVGIIFGLVSISAAHRVVKPKPPKAGLRQRRQHLLQLLGGAS
jgi:hypothetical protein